MSLLQFLKKFLNIDSFCILVLIFFFAAICYDIGKLEIINSGFYYTDIVSNVSEKISLNNFSSSTIFNSSVSNIQKLTQKELIEREILYGIPCFLAISFSYLQIRYNNFVKKEKK